MHNWLQQEWSRASVWQIVLLPIAWLFQGLVFVRRGLYRLGVFKVTQLPVPVIVVGNINVGGTGKTPLVIWLVEQLIAQGYQPGVISRGYTAGTKVDAEIKTKTHNTSFAKLSTAQQVTRDSQPHTVGDEPVLLANRLTCPVFVCADRVAAGQALLNAYPQCDVIISDDGLQHYALARQFEIVVVDAAKGFGNQALLPAGPLREPMLRLKTVNAIVVNGVAEDTEKQALNAFSQKNFTVFHGYMPAANTLYAMQLVAQKFYHLIEPQRQCIATAFAQQTIVAIAGIGNPARFFTQLQALGLHFSSQAYADHHAFTKQDISTIDAQIIVMTEKDAVKCREFADARCWVLPVNAALPADFLPAVLHAISTH